VAEGDPCFSPAPPLHVFHGHTISHKREGESECIDLIRFNDLDRERDLRIRVPDEVLPNEVDVLIDRRILIQLHLTLDFGRQPPLRFRSCDARMPVSPVRPASIRNSWPINWAMESG